MRRFPGRTYFFTSPGSVCVSNSAQYGHCRSMYSVIVTGAFAEPSVVPSCGRPLKSAATSPAPGSVSPFVSEPTAGMFFGVLFDEPPVNANTAPMTTATRTTTPAIARRTRGEACRPRVVGVRRPRERPGGGAAAAARRRSLLFLPLAIAGQGTPLLASGCPQNAEVDQEQERGQRHRRDRDVAELVHPLRRAAARRGDEARGALLDHAPLDEDVVDGHARAHDRQRQQVPRDAVVVRERREQQDDRERVHADPLVPAELARDEVRDLGEEEAAARRDRGDEEPGPELVAPEHAAHEVERPAHAERGEEGDHDPRSDEHLADDCQRREEDDHVVRHPGTSTRTAPQLVARPSAPHSTRAPSIRTPPLAGSSSTGIQVTKRRIGPSGALPLNASC